MRLALVHTATPIPEAWDDASLESMAATCAAGTWGASAAEAAAAWAAAHAAPGAGGDAPARSQSAAEAVAGLRRLLALFALVPGSTAARRTVPLPARSLQLAATAAPQLAAALALGGAESAALPPAPAPAPVSDHAARRSVEGSSSGLLADFVSRERSVLGGRVAAATADAGASPRPAAEGGGER